MYRIDDETLREVLDNPSAARRRLRDLELPPLDHDLAAMGERVALLRLLGRLDEAEELGRRALARTVGNARRQVTAMIRLATVLQWQERYDEADEIFAQALADADKLGDDLLRAFAHQHYGRSLFDQREFAAALAQFDRALRVRVSVSAPADQIASSRQALRRAALAAAQSTTESPRTERQHASRCRSVAPDSPNSGRGQTLEA